MSGLMFCTCIQSSNPCSTVSHYCFVSTAWHQWISRFVSFSSWHHGHCVLVQIFHHCMFTPYGRNLAADLAIHLHWARGINCIAWSAVSQSTMCTAPLPYLLSLPNDAGWLFHWCSHSISLEAASKSISLGLHIASPHRVLCTELDLDMVAAQAALPWHPSQCSSMPHMIMLNFGHYPGGL